MTGQGQVGIDRFEIIGVSNAALGNADLRRLSPPQSWQQ